jgi:Flp pilus assembly pilin Flp
VTLQLHPVEDELLLAVGAVFIDGGVSIVVDAVRRVFVRYGRALRRRLAASVMTTKSS